MCEAGCHLMTEKMLAVQIVNIISNVESKGLYGKSNRVI